MPIAGSGHVYRVTFRSLVTRNVSVSSTPHLVPQPVSFNLFEIPDTETSGKDTDSEAEGMPNMGIREKRRSKQDGSMAMHSLQTVAEELRKIHELKI